MSRAVIAHASASRVSSLAGYFVTLVRPDLARTHPS